MPPQLLCLALVDDFLRDDVRRYFFGQQFFRSVTSNLPVHGINHLELDLLDVLRRCVRNLLHLNARYVVWSVEYFNYYFFGKSITIITGHRALLSIMKEHRSNKTYNSRLTRSVDRLLPFDLNIEQIPGAKTLLVDYISRQQNQEAKVTNKDDEELAVATITRIRDATTAIYVNTTRQNCQSQHFSSVNYTHFTRASHHH